MSKKSKSARFDPFERPTTGISVDASVTGGNPGWGEYRGTDLSTGEVLFHHVVGMCTNNVCEFIALCHGLVYAMENNYQRVYSDSQVARSWVKSRKCNTNSLDNPKTRKSIQWAGKAVMKICNIYMSGNRDSFIANGKVQVNIRKWDTIHWGQIPADFGRK